MASTSASLASTRIFSDRKCHGGSANDGDENPGYEIPLRSLISADVYPDKANRDDEIAGCDEGSTNAAGLGGERNGASASKWDRERCEHPFGRFGRAH
jgi:hypothetical protein